MKPGISFISVYIVFPVWSVLLSLSANASGQEQNKGSGNSVSGTQPLYMLTYDHGGLVLWGTEHFARYLHSATDWLSRYPGFKIGLDNEAYTYDFLSRNDTVLLNEIRNDLNKFSGRFGIGTCTYGQPLSQFINEESNIRQIGYAIETDRELLHVEPSVYLMSEHAMHSQIPQILNGFGFKGAIMRTHFMMYGYNPTYQSPIGWWTGRDGSRIPAIPTYKGEGSGFGWVTEDNLILTRYPGPECKEPMEAFREKFRDIHPLLATRADDSGLRQEGLVKEVEGNPDFKWLLLEEIFRTFPAPLDEYRTLPDDFHVRMPWGYCGNEIWNMSRRAEARVLTAERLAALELLSGGKDHEPELEKAWKNLLVAQHHDIQICGILEDSRRFLPASVLLSDSVIHSSMDFFASGMQGGKLGQITVFNPLSWTWKGWMEVNASLPADCRYFQIKQGDIFLPYEAVSSVSEPGKKSVLVNLLVKTEIPPLAIQSYALTKSVKPPESTPEMEFDRQSLKISTPFWKITLDKNGGISTLISCSSGRELFQSKRSCFFAGVIDGRSLESSGTWNPDSVVLNKNQLILVETGLIGTIPYRLEMRLYSYSSRLDYNVTFQFNEEKIGRLSENKREIASAFLHEEKLRFKLFPVLGIGTTGIRDLPFTIAETDDPYIEGNYWTALADGHSGVAILNHGNMGSVHEADGGFSVPLAYSMYYVWKTVMLKGNFTYEFSVFPFEGRWELADLHKKALEYNFPLLKTFTPEGNAQTGNRVQLFDISLSGVIMSALYTREEQPYLRFYETQGINDTLNLNFLKGSCSISEVNLRGKIISDAASRLNFTPWKIKTVKLDIRK
jgi:hypothetical protein